MAQFGAPGSTNARFGDQRSKKRNLKLAANLQCAKLAALSLTSTLTRPVLLVFLATVFRFSVEAAIFTVSNTSDSGPGSLRHAIDDANLAPDHDTIVFNITPPTPASIAPGSPLPALTSPVLIDGTTQPGYAGEPIVGLVGTGAGTASGLVLQGGNSEVRGLFINRFSGNGIQIQSQSNVVSGCFIGTSPAGTARLPNNAAGVAILSARHNRIGGTNSGERNILSGNQTGLWIAGNTATGNVAQGNFIGTDITGTTNLGNGNNGVLLSAPGNIIGGTIAVARNIISGNGQSGVYLNDAFASNNWVCGNFIGTKANGTAALSNTVDGVTIFRAARNLIGGSNPGARNIISGNGERGVYLFAMGGGTVNGNRIEGNFIGADATGLANLGNRFSGVGISFGNDNVVGGTNVLARNVISANKQSGVAIESNSMANIVAGNFIGLDATGTGALPNTFNGVLVVNGVNNVIGGTASGAGNVISGNAQVRSASFGRHSHPRAGKQNRHGRQRATRARQCLRRRPHRVRGKFRGRRPRHRTQRHFWKCENRCVDVWPGGEQQYGRRKLHRHGHHGHSRVGKFHGDYADECATEPHRHDGSRGRQRHFRQC